MSVPYSLQEIVLRLGGELVGDGSVLIERVASLSNAKPGQITFYVDSKYRTVLENTRASAVIVSHNNRNTTDLPRIIAENPYAYFAKLSALFNPPAIPEKGVALGVIVHSSTRIPDTCSIAANCVLGRNVVLGENVTLAAGCVIGDQVQIGDNTTLQANVVVYQACVIGKNCTLLSGCVIGADGFGYAEESGRWVKIPQVGRVVIGDNVDVGVNTTIDRGALDDTIIEEGVKLDNLIQIGHNCRIGAHTIIAGCVGIAGSACIGRHCRIGGAAMILGHLEIADHTVISPGSMITRSLSRADTYTALMPFQSHQEWLKTAANIRRLGDLSERVKWLEKKLAATEVAANTKQLEEKP
ncbi:MAG: UDP-3-O-(3-hydroxymyristoyl)glucosamine N-acyltransferase [Methylophilaceae bacterium]|nr:UDP-3-O-(3-hydroxymyristoyl)glucosamine N-acyltransferase [Methylophilaceae bacterium]